MLKRQNCCLTGEKRIALFIKPSKLKQLRNNSFYLGITGVVLFIGNVGHQRWFIVGEALVVLHPRYVVLSVGTMYFLFLRTSVGLESFSIRLRDEFWSNLYQF